MRFVDRRDAGQRLGELFVGTGLHAPIVLALPRGGVPVAFEVARALRAPLDVFVARKIGAPGHREFGIGAIAEGGEVVADQVVLRSLGITAERFEQLAAGEGVELQRRVRQYRGDRPLPDLDGHDVVLVDDGLATGVTAEAAVRSLKRTAARRVILAVPVCARDAEARLRSVADDVVSLSQPADFVAVGLWYHDFTQTTDDEVVRLLADA